MSKLIRYGDYNPFEEMERMMDTMRGMMERTWPTRLVMGDTSSLALDVREDENNVIVKTAIPGVSEEDIDVNIQGDLLTISAESRNEHEQEEHGWHMREMRYGKFARSVRLPAEVQRDKIEADLSNGVLTITLPKAQQSPVQKIKVKAQNVLKGSSKQVKSGNNQ